MTNCRKYLDWATSPVGGLEPPAAVARHLEGCGVCESARVQLATEIGNLEGLVDDVARATPVPSDFSARVLAAAGTPSWMLRRPSTWTLPVAAMVGLTFGSLGLLHPLPAGLVESWAPLAAVSSPLVTLGELVRLLASSGRLLVEPLGVGAGPVATVVSLLSAAGLALGVRRLVRGPAVVNARR